MKDLKISKELISEVLGCDCVKTDIKDNTLEYFCDFDDVIDTIKINIYEFAFKNLKQWAKLKNVFDKIDWSEEPEQIFKKAEKLKNEIN